MSKKYLVMVDGNEESGFEPIELKENGFDENGNVLDDVLTSIDVIHSTLDSEDWDEVELIYLDPVPNIPEDKRFAIIRHPFVEEGYGEAFCSHNVVSFYDRKTRAYTTLNVYDRFGLDIILEVDYNGIFEKGHDELFAECQSIDEWELMDANKWLERLVKTVVELSEKHEDIHGRGCGRYDDFEKIDGDASLFIKYVFEFENRIEPIAMDSDYSPLSELPKEYANREDWERHAIFMEGDSEEDGEDWEAYFEKEYPRETVYLAMKCDTPKRVEGVSHPDIFVAVRKFRKMYPDVTILHAESWDSPDAVFILDADNEEQVKTLWKLAYDPGEWVPATA